MAKNSQGTGNSSTSTTKTKTNGNVIELGPGDDKDYLCENMCFAKKVPLKGKVGQFLHQRTCTAAIWAQEEWHELIWKYKAEVGYRMRDIPPSPIMSEKKAQRPSRFPLGVAAREGMFKISLADLESSAKGRLRIPDIILLKVTDNELIKMRTTGFAQWYKLIPHQSNIDKVIELKFGNDKLSRGQRQAYQRIAGDKSKFKLLSDKDCNCTFRNDDSNSNGTGTVGAKYTYINNLFVSVHLKHQMGISTPIASNTPTPISDFLDNAPLYELGVGAGIVVVIVGAIVLLPASAAVAGAGALGGYVLATS